jgi:hypothetical protein
MSFFSRDDTHDADRSQGFGWKRANLLSDQEMFEATVVSQQRRQRSDFLRKEKPRQHQREPPVPNHSTQGKSSSTETRKGVERIDPTPSPYPQNAPPRRAFGGYGDSHSPHGKKSATFSADKSMYYLTSRAIEMFGAVVTQVFMFVLPTACHAQN